MDAAAIQDKIYYGYGKAADRIGLGYVIYRSSDGQNPLDPLNIVGDILVSPTTSFSYAVPRKYGNSVWQLLLDGRDVQVGDYLVGPLGKTFFVAAKQHMLPIIGVLCDRTISIKVPVSPTAKGFTGYSGYVDADSSTFESILLGCPASFVRSSKSQSNPVTIPTTSKMPWYSVFIPTWPGVFIREGSIITDENFQQYVVSANEQTELGWNLNVHGLET